MPSATTTPSLAMRCWCARPRRAPTPTSRITPRPSTTCCARRPDFERREHDADLRTFPCRPPCHRAGPRAARLAGRHPGRAAPHVQAAAAGSLRAAGGAPLHAAVAEELLHRHALLSARLVHDEVQPAGLQ